MKITLFSLILNDRPVEEAIALASRIGYQGIELQGREPHLPVETTLARAREIRAVADDAGLPIVCLASYTGGYASLSDAECQKQLDDLKRFMEIGEVLGCRMIRHNAGAPSPRKAEEHHWSRCAEWMGRAADLAAQGGFRLVMELHFGSLVESAESASRLLKMIGRPNVGVTYDPGNMFIAGVPWGAEQVKLLGSSIFHVHVKDEIEAGDASGPGVFQFEGRYRAHRLLNHGSVDHRPVIAALREIGYNGCLSVECHIAGMDRAAIAWHEYIALREMLEG